MRRPRTQCTLKVGVGHFSVFSSLLLFALRFVSFIALLLYGLSAHPSLFSPLRVPFSSSSLFSGRNRSRLPDGCPPRRGHLGQGAVRRPRRPTQRHVAEGRTRVHPPSARFPRQACSTKWKQQLRLDSLRTLDAQPASIAHVNCQSNLSTTYTFLPSFFFSNLFHHLHCVRASVQACSISHSAVFHEGKVMGVESNHCFMRDSMDVFLPSLAGGRVL